MSPLAEVGSKVANHDVVVSRARTPGGLGGNLRVRGHDPYDRLHAAGPQAAAKDATVCPATPADHQQAGRTSRLAKTPRPPPASAGHAGIAFWIRNDLRRRLRSAPEQVWAVLAHCSAVRPARLGRELSRLAARLSHPASDDPRASGPWPADRRRPPRVGRLDGRPLDVQAVLSTGSSFVNVSLIAGNAGRRYSIPLQHC